MAIAARKKSTYVANRSEKLKRAKGYRLKAQYGLSLEEYAAMLEAQNGVCAICLKLETSRSNPKCERPDSLRVDHCHVTGKNRGLLCSECNFGISKFDDDTDLMRKAIEYLEFHQSKEKK